MKLSIKAMSSVSALIWGASILLVCLLHLAMPQYGAGSWTASVTFTPVSKGHKAWLTPYWEPGTQSWMEELADSFLPGCTTRSRTCKQRRRVLRLLCLSG